MGQPPKFLLEQHSKSIKTSSISSTTSTTGFSTPNYGVSNQGGNQLEGILKSFIQDTKNQFQAQGVSIKNLENQVGKIASALSSKTLGSLPSTNENPTSTSGTRVVMMCKVIKLRSGNNCEGTSDQI